MTGKRWIGTILLCMLCLASCGPESQPQESEEKVTETVDWKTNGFAVSEELGETQELWAAEYIRWEHDEVGDISYDPDTEDLYEKDPTAYGEKTYQMYYSIIWDGDEDVKNSQNRGNRLWLEVYDTTSMQASFTELDAEKAGLQHVRPYGYGVIKDGEYVFHGQEYGQEWTGGVPVGDRGLLFLDEEGTGRWVDMESQYEEWGISKDLDNSECICDELGNVYLKIDKKGYTYQMYIVDKDGALLMNYDLGDQKTVQRPFRMSGGDLIFPVYDKPGQKSLLVWFDLEKKEEHIIAELEKELVNQVYGIQGNDIYYENTEGIVRWDIVSGERTLIYRLSENGVSYAFRTMMIFRDGQSPILRMNAEISGEREDWLVVLSDQQQSERETVRVVSFIEETPWRVKTCAAVASRRYPQLTFTCETCTEEQRDRVLADMVAGKGPDILYVSWEDMELLQSKGMLKDLNTVMPQEAIEQVLPGVIEMGTVDGAFVGLAPEVNAYVTAVTLKSVWDKDRWDLQDILELLETGDYPCGVLCQDTMPFTKNAMFGQLVQWGLEGSELVDWETGESHFESEFFIRLLEDANQYAPDDPFETGKPVPEAWVGKGGCLAKQFSVELDRLDDLYEEYGEEYHYVGLPWEKGAGIYIWKGYNDGVIVVNGNLDDTEAAGDFLECLLRDEIQYPDEYLSCQPIMRVSQEDILTVEYDGIPYYFWKGHRLALREDGSNYLKEYQEMLESSVPEPKVPYDLQKIVFEESDSYFSGDKSAAEAAEVIDNRVQNYLNETGGL